MPQQAIEHIQRRLSHDIPVKFDRIFYLTGVILMMVFGQKENTDGVQMFLVHNALVLEGTYSYSYLDYILKTFQNSLGNSPETMECFPK